MKNKPIEKVRRTSEDDYFYVQKGTEARATWISLDIPSWIKPGMLVKIHPSDFSNQTLRPAPLIQFTVKNPNPNHLSRSINTGLSSCVVLVVKIHQDKKGLDVIWKDEVASFNPRTDFKFSSATEFQL